MRIGIDLGGSKIEGVVLDERNSVQAKLRQPTPADSYRAIITAISEMVDELERLSAQSCTLGIGTPGAISPHTGRMKNSNTQVLNDQPLKSDLEKAIGKTVYLANDANCLALSESVDGVGAKAKSVFGVIIGTGTGGGLVYDGAPIIGANAIAGEWGHNPLPFRKQIDEPSIECYCGKTACIETYLCGAGFSRLYEYLGGEWLSAETIAIRAKAEEPLACLALESYAQRLARGLSCVINIFDPEIVVLGGGLSQLPGLSPLVEKFLPEFVFSDHVSTQVCIAKYGDSSGVRGAAWLPARATQT